MYAYIMLLGALLVLELQLHAEAVGETVEQVIYIYIYMYIERAR